MSVHFFLTVTIVVSSQLLFGTRADLNREAKQILLDRFNYIRAENRRNQLQWNVKLAEEAQEQAGTCGADGITLGTNLYYNKTDHLPATIQQRFRPDRVNHFKARELQSVTWPLTTEVGCGHMMCEVFVETISMKLFDIELYVCKFSPSEYQLSRTMRLRADRGPCTNTEEDDKICPSNLPFCVEFESEVLGADFNNPGFKYCAKSRDMRPTVPDSMQPPPSAVIREVRRLSPRRGSLAGGSTLNLTGIGFSLEGINTVTLVDRNDQSVRVPCEIVILHTTPVAISCTTGPAPDIEKDTEFELVVRTSDDGVFYDVEVCPRCTFRYRLADSPLLHYLSPLALLSGEELTLTGDFSAVDFGDPDNTGSDGPADSFVRILAGGLLCNHYAPNGTKLHSSIEANGKRGSISCIPDSCRIASMNVTVILAIQGTTFVHPDDYLFSVDNNMQPYHIQTHADILDVVPSKGSTAGGTELSITVSGCLGDYYSEEIQVFIGGIQCLNVSANSIDNKTWIIHCITQEEPEASQYYPGERGVLREVFFGTTDHETLLRAPRSNFHKRHERVYRHYQSTPPDFQEVSGFSERFSGFFVPPASSYYTASVLADGGCVLYFGADNSTINLTFVPGSKNSIDESYH